MNKLRNFNISNSIISAFSWSKNRNSLIENYIVASIFLNKNDLNLDLDLLGRRLEYFACKSITIFYINEENTFFQERFHTQEGLDYKIISLPYDDFFEQPDFIKNIFLKRINLRKSIFIFKSKSWIEVTTNFKKNNIIISGGTNTKRHILSPNQLWLSQFITFISVSNSIIDSFHNSKKSESRPIIDLTSKESISSFYEEMVGNSSDLEEKERRISLWDEKSIIYKDSEDILLKKDKFDGNKKIDPKNNLLNIQKRMYHSTNNLMNKIIVKNENNIINYLDSIEEIINKCEFNTIESQKLIEKKIGQFKTSSLIIN